MYRLGLQVLNIDLARGVLDPIALDGDVKEEEPLYDRFGIDQRTEDIPHADFPMPPLRVASMEELTSDHERQRLRKWASMFRKWNNYFPSSWPDNADRPPEMPRNFPKLRSRAYKGIPDGARQVAWSRLLHADELVRRNEDDIIRFSGTAASSSPDVSAFGRCLRTPIPFEEQGSIGRDIRRTFRGFALLSCREGMLMLSRLLIAVAAADPRVGYMQSFSFIAAAFLNYMPEVDAFWAFKALMNHNDFYLCYAPGLPGVLMRCWTLDRLLERRVPRWARVIKNAGGLLDQNPSAIWATKFIMTLFFRDLPFALAVRIFDRFLVDGELVIYRVLIALVERELAGPVCRTRAELTAAMTAGKLPALDSPAYTMEDGSCVLLQRFSTIAERVTLDTAQDLLDRSEAGPPLRDQDIQELYATWRETLGRECLAASYREQQRCMDEFSERIRDQEAERRAARLAVVLSSEISFDSDDHLVGIITDEIADVLTGHAGTANFLEDEAMVDSAQHLRMAYSHDILHSPNGDSDDPADDTLNCSPRALTIPRTNSNTWPRKPSVAMQMQIMQIYLNSDDSSSAPHDAPPLPPEIAPS